MSVHTLIGSNITNYDSLIGILDELGIKWEHVAESYMKSTGLPPAYAIEAIIGNEIVSIFQVNEGDKFIFQSQGWWFRNKGSIQSIANLVSSEDIHQQRMAAEKQRQDFEARRRIEEEERQKRLAAERERRRIEEQERQERIAAEKERERLAEQKRQENLSKEAANILSRLDTEREQVSKLNNPQMQSPLPPSAPDLQQDHESNEEMDRFIAKIHYENALRKVKNEFIPKIDEKYSIMKIDETMEDEIATLRITI